MTDYYVATDGVDSNPGTEAQPWKTIQKAADTLTAGDTVYIKSGTYNERVEPQSSGSPGNYVTYTSYPGDTVTIDGTGIYKWPKGLFRIYQKNYIKVSGLRIENFIGDGGCYGIYILEGCDHIIIENNYINNIDGCGIHSFRDISNLIIDNNEVCYTNLEPTWDQEMVSLSHTDTFAVKNNHVHDSEHIGIDAKRDCVNGVIFNNHIHNCGPGIELDARGSIHDIDIYQNVIHDSGEGIEVGCETASGTLTDINIYNNLAYNNVNGFAVHVEDVGIKTNIKVINNTFYNNTISMQITDYGEEFVNFVIRNNILSSDGTGGMINFPRIVEENVHIDHNIFTDNSDVYGDNYIKADPRFENPNAGDFHLQSDSPAIDAGSSVGAPSIDYDGSSRPQGAGYDIGAYEYTGTTPDTTPPSITSHSPSGIDIAINTNILVGFSEAMNKASAENAFSISPNVAGSITWSGDTMTFNPSSGLSNSTAYAINVATSAEDLAGNGLQSPYGWQFATTAGAQPPPPPELVAHYKFDDGLGDTAVDSSGNNNTGTLMNNPQWVADGRVNGALQFDGVAAYVDCGLGPSLQITGAITVEAWVKWAGSGNPYFVTKFGNSTHRSYDLSGNDDGTVEFRVGGTGCNIIGSSGTTLIPANEWVYLVGTYEPSSYVRLFVNGALAKESTTSVPASQCENGLPWYIGAREGNQGWFDGVIDEVKIYNGALSAEEVLAQYQAYTLTPITFDTTPKGASVLLNGTFIGTT